MRQASKRIPESAEKTVGDIRRAPPLRRATQSSASKVRYSTNSASRSNRPADVPRRLGANQPSMLSRRASHCTAIPKGARTGTAG